MTSSLNGISKFLTIASIATLAVFASNRAHSDVQLSITGEIDGGYLIHSDAASAFGFTVGNQDYFFDGVSALLSSNLTLAESTAHPIVFSLYAADSNGIRTGAALVTLTTDPITEYSGEQYRFFTPTSSTPFTLQANSTYVIVPSSDVVWFSYYAWYGTNSAAYGPQETDWAPFPGTSRSSDGGVTWTMVPNVLLLADIYATPVPEPSSIMLLLGVGAAALLMKRRARRN